MEDFVRKTKGVRDITSLPLDTSNELDIVSDVKGKIYIKILNRYKELLFDNGTEQWVIDMLNNLEVDLEQLKEDILDAEQALSELPIIEDKLATVETTLAQINTLFAQMQIDVQGLDLRTAELEREVVQLALKDQELLDKINNLDVDLDILYSNSTDFGNYDYSGNPNLLSKLSYDLLANQNVSAGTLSEGENSLKYTKTSTEVDGGVALYYKQRGIANWLPSNKNLVMTVKLRAGVDYSPADGKKIMIRYRYVDNGTNQMPLDLHVNSASLTQEWQEFSVIGTTSTFSPQANDPWIQFYAQAGILGEIEMSYDIKIEEGPTATPYQPNLLAEPYNMCREYPNENIADPTVKLPIKAGAYTLYQADMEEEFVLGQTYTITIKATKPSTQTFTVYNEGNVDYKYGNLVPVEGLSDTWGLTFTPRKVGVDYPKRLTIIQFPRSTAGACQIDWLKIEKSKTRTPNIPYYKYVGINTEASKNPNDYEWIPLAKAAETVDARLTKTISTYDTVNALQNNRLTALESKVVDTTWQNVTVTEPFTSVTQPQVKKQNGIVYMRGTISNGTGDCFTLPEGFRPPAGAYEMQFRLPCRSADASDYATMYVRPSGLCSIVGVNGTKPIFLSGIIFSTT